MTNIEIYTKVFCPYCSRATALLERRGLAFQEYDITMDAHRRREMIDRASGRMTVPQIFIDGRHVGGSDDLTAADRSGELDAMLGTAP